jgi:Domain of Unknown Function (DUF1080)
MKLLFDRKPGYVAFAVMSAALLSSPRVPAAANSPFAGRWDLTITTPKGAYPSWIEIQENGAEPSIRLQGRVASVHPVTPFKLDGNRLAFTTSEWFGKQTKVDWEFTANGSTLVGVQNRTDGVKGNIVGVRAPLLDRPVPASWSTPEPLFNGKDLTGWKSDATGPMNWKAVGGNLLNEAPGANLIGTRKLQDFKLHVELNCPDKGNSGIYLRGRYEMQVSYEKEPDLLHSMGAIYGFVEPVRELTRMPGQWETFDITLIGRHVTIVRNGETTIDNQEIPGITGGALNSHEAEPGPIYIQGDHTGGMKYRNITVSVPK